LVLRALSNWHAFWGRAANQRPLVIRHLWGTVL
jgi:hypothetical protein